jgi:hypothetical protein
MYNTVRGVVHDRPSCESSSLLLQAISTILGFAIMDNDDANCKFTTNARDLQKAADLQARLSVAAASAEAPTVGNKVDDESVIPSVSIDAGAYKYVLVSAVPPSHSSDLVSSSRLFVYSKRGAQYHVNVAEYLVPQLEGNGYTNIRILGGGRILRDDDDRRVHIYGHSYGFGMADHKSAMDVVSGCTTYSDYKVTWQVISSSSREHLPCLTFIPLISSIRTTRRQNKNIYSSRSSI